ncbi:MAG: PHP domain-containing protein, partial [Solirubrobacteraceae bacterium]
MGTAIRPQQMRTCVRVPYAELHCHSAFSFLDGASLPDELVTAALELGYEALALTDHNSVSGSMEFAVSARALGLRAIHGAEIDLEPDDSRAAQSGEAGCRTGRKREGRHLTLLVSDARGWSNLCRILTRAHARTREGRPGAPPAGRLERHRDELGRMPSRWQARAGAPPSEPSIPLETVLEHAEGLVCLSGCALHGVHDEPTLRRLL